MNGSHLTVFFFILVNNIPKIKKRTWTKESNTLNNIIKKIGGIKAIKDFYWKRDVKRKFIKAEFYDNNKLLEANKYLDLCYNFPSYFLVFNGS